MNNSIYQIVQMDENPVLQQVNYQNSAKIDSQSIVQEYRNMRNQQKQFLQKINLSAKLKCEIFDFPSANMKNFTKPDQGQKLVVVLDPFRGRLIMKNRVWMQIKNQRQKQEQKVESQMRIRKEKQIMELNRKMRQQQQQKQRQRRLQQQNAASNEQQNKKGDTEGSDIMNIFSALFKPKNENENQEGEEKMKNKSKPSLHPIKQSMRQQTMVRDQNSRVTNLSAGRERSQIVKDEFGDGRNQISSNEYNIKIQGNGRTSTKLQVSNPDQPKRNRLDSGVLNSNHTKAKNYQSAQQNYQTPNQRKSMNGVQSKQRMSMNPKNQNNEQISEIYKKEVKDIDSNPSLALENRAQSESLEEILKSKKKLAAQGRP